MDNQFKICGNCGHCTMSDGEFICIDPTKQQKIVPMGARRPCFVVSPLPPEQFKSAAMAPSSAAIH